MIIPLYSVSVRIDLISLLIFLHQSKKIYLEGNWKWKWCGWGARGLQNICLHKLIIPKSCTMTVQGGGGAKPLYPPLFSFTLKFCPLLLDLTEFRRKCHLWRLAYSSFKVGLGNFSIFNLKLHFNTIWQIYLEINLTNTLKMYIWYIQPGHKHRCLRTEPIQNGSRNFSNKSEWLKRYKEGWELMWKFWKYFLFWFTLWICISNVYQT